MKTLVKSTNGSYYKYENGAWVYVTNGLPTEADYLGAGEIGALNKSILVSLPGLVEGNMKPLVTVYKKAPDDPFYSPGEIFVQKGDTTAGFFGEVTTADFGADHAQIYSLIGLSSGTLQNQTEPFLKFIHDGKIKFIPKKSTRHSVSWDAINIALGGSANGAPAEKTITVGDYQYKVRFMRGAGRTKLVEGRIATADYAHTDRASIWSSTDNGVTGNWSANSENEWNTLILPVHVHSDGGGANKNNFSHPAYAPDYVPDWASYSDVDLNITGDGSYVWCAETRDDSTASRVSRCHLGSTHLSVLTSSSAGSFVGSRLVFELL